MSAPDPSPIRTVCVYCGSSPGKHADFVAGAQALGTAMARGGLDLVYGGGDRGLMGAVARAVLDGGGKVTGIIPEFLLSKEQPDGADDLRGAEMITVPDMHTRKHMMFDKADAFIALPGGIGTLEEVVEMLTWAQLARHSKPIIILNTKGFWTPFADLLDHMEDAQFLHNPDRARPQVCDTPEAAVALLTKR